MPHPRHDIARYLEEITKPVIVKEIADPIERCLMLKSNIAKNLRFSSKEVKIIFHYFFSKFNLLKKIKFEAGDFEKFLAKYAFNMIEKNEVMLICHKLDVSGETLRRNKVEFKKTATSIWNFNTVVMK